MEGQATLPPLAGVVDGAADGSWVTFVPGIGNDVDFWHQQAMALSDRHRVLRFDPWGIGDSGQPPQGCTVETVADGIVALWDSLGIGRSSVVGLGFGGSTALALATRHPERIDRVVACCCRARQPDDRRQFWVQRANTAETDGLAGLATATVERWFDDSFRAEHPDEVEQLRAAFMRSSPAAYAAFARAFAVMDLESELAALAAPTLLIAAENDHGGGPVADMKELADALPTATLEVVMGSGHIVNRERPEQVSHLLREFLADLRS